MGLLYLFIIYYCEYNYRTNRSELPQDLMINIVARKNV